MIISFQNKKPNISNNSFIAENTTVIGDVTIGEEVSVWFGVVIRGDLDSIHIGKGSNIQDNCVVHVGYNNKTTIGDYVTVGHGAIVHGAEIGDNCLIGMGAVILDGAELGDYTIVAAGSLVPPGKKIPSGVLCLGNPAKVVRELTEEEKIGLVQSARNYIELYKNYK
jgi:carbonic anhydrase/acetyltransferase-like protein (isoleucine patch superfamily)